MNIEDMLAQQKKLSKKRKPISDSFDSLTVEDYIAEAEGNRPYSEEVAPANGKQKVSKTPVNGKQKVSKTPVNGKQKVSPPPLITDQESTKLPKGLQLKVCLFIFNSCIKNKQRITGPVNLVVISNHVGTSKNTIKNALLRLKQKNIISLVEYERGRGGWARYKISEVVFNLISDYLLINSEQIEGDKWLAKPTSSSSSYNNNTITTKLGLNLKKLRTLLGRHHESISEKTLAKVLENPSLTIAQVQDSIDHFCYTLEYHPSSPSLNRKVKVACLLTPLKEGRPYVDFDFRTPDQIELDRTKPSQEEIHREISEWRLKLTQLNGEVEHWSKFLALNKDTSQEENMRSFLKEAQQKLIQHMDKKPEGAD